MLTHHDALFGCYVARVATFLLIHGACHGAWCWEAVAPLLNERHEVVAPDLPCDDVEAGLEEYAELCLDALAGVRGDVVVVGHSLGALTASVVAARREVTRLVFVAGIIGQPGRSLQEIAAEDQDRDIPLGADDFESDSTHRFRFTPSGARRVLYHDCTDDVASAAIARLRFQRSLWTDRAMFDEWPRCEIVSIVCSDDRVVNPVWSRGISLARLGVQPVEMAGGHSPFFTRPADLAAVLMAGVGP
jgi:pimeloyl-ACP methyl ester carboxylesterase